MDHREKVFIGLLALAIIAIAYMVATRPRQVDISPRPDKPLSDEPLEALPVVDDTPSVSAYHGMFLWPLGFAKPLPLTSVDVR